ncbi:MAG: acyl carrier protein [Acetobacteraceae bacterium]|nr:acyl carrier protein [Acetobacteraceae bacterium]
MPKQTEAEIRSFIAENFLFREGRASLGEDESLLEAGLIDSTGVLELVAFLEQHFGLRIPDADMVPENLDSVRGLVTYVEARLSAAQPVS